MNIKRAATVFSIVALAACGDGKGPALISLDEAQAEDLMDALAQAGAFDAGAGLSVASAARASNAAVVAHAVFTTTVSASGPCPNGGTAGVNGSMTMNDNNAPTITMTMEVAQSFSACRSTSTEGNLWTFSGAPNITSNFSMTMNETTGIFSMTGTQKGALDVTGPEGSGRCPIDISFTFSGNDQAGTFSGSLTGTVCGVSISQTVDLTE
jgi:hypothetical protein